MAGLAWYVALAFAGFEIGKAAHDAEMRQFFLGSGYPVAFMYAVMAVEIVGALGLLAARLRIAAAVLLGLVMLGAIATHARNGDPFSDSLDATRMLLLAASIVALGAYQHGRRTVAA
ncbi:DoxX family protein [Rhodanobacter sp. DHG33]|nr:DoxX family protein [Rhodanobacter sp. DHG33]